MTTLYLASGARLDDRKPGGSWRICRARYSSGALAPAIFHLRHLLLAGMPLAGALDSVAALELSQARRELWRDVGAEVESGASLSQALSAFPADFDATALALTRAGEASGRLAALLSDLEAHLRWRHELAARVRTVTFYPLFATLMLLGVMGFLLGHVVPALSGFLGQTGESLAWHGELLLALSGAVAGHGAIAVLIIASPLLFLVIAPWLGAAIHRRRDGLMIRCGAPGRLLAALCTARWARTTALLHQSGVELVDALDIAQGTLGNRAMQFELASVRTSLLTGKGLGTALRDCPSVPASLSRLVIAGESAGALDAALHSGAEHLQASSRHAIDRLEALIGPVLLCVAGGLLLWIVVSVLSPIYATVGAEVFL